MQATSITDPQLQDAILSRLEKVSGPSASGEFQARCVFHSPDNHPSLSVSFEKNVYHCHRCGSSGPTSRLAQALGIDTGGGGYSGDSKRRNTATVKKSHARPTPNESVASTASASSGECNSATVGLTLASLAEAKHLPLDFLKSLGLSDFQYSGRPAVRIPYVNETGEVVAVRFRLALVGDQRFVWRRGDRVNLYGLERLPHAQQLGWVLIVEGESDCWTCWYHGLPAVGVPGKTIWRREWVESLDGLAVYVWVEPGADDFALRIGEAIPTARVIAAQGIKDLSEAHCQGVDIPSLMAGLKDGAEPVETFKARLADARLGELKDSAQSILDCDDPLAVVESTIRTMGYGGDVTPALVTYLAATSRLLAMRQGAMPVHLLLTGQSASGKSYTLTIVKRLLPPDGYHEIDAGSPRVLIYEEDDLRHRALLFGEADSLPAGEDNPAASAVRNLLQDHELHYRVTVRDATTGDYTVREVAKPGPTVLLTTSTRPLGEQLSTRLFTLEISDSQAQIAAAMECQASLEVGGESAPDDTLIAFQAYLQAKAPWYVIVPFAKALAEGMSTGDMAPRLLRDFARLLSLIKAVAVLRHTKRTTDADGRIVAEIDDYESVRGLLEETYAETIGGPTAAIRELVEAVGQMDTAERLTVGKLAAHLGLNKGTISRRARKAARLGWLINRESRRGRPADYALGDPLPDPCALPTVERVLQCCTTSDGMQQSMHHSSEAKSGECCTVAPFTDDKIPPSPPEVWRNGL